MVVWLIVSLQCLQVSRASHRLEDGNCRSIPGLAGDRSPRPALPVEARCETSTTPACRASSLTAPAVPQLPYPTADSANPVDVNATALVPGEWGMRGKRAFFGQNKEGQMHPRSLSALPATRVAPCRQELGPPSLWRSSMSPRPSRIGFIPG